MLMNCLVLNTVVSLRALRSIAIVPVSTDAYDYVERASNSDGRNNTKRNVCSCERRGTVEQAEKLAIPAHARN